MTTQTTKPDVYRRDTARILADLEKGVRPWVRPWNAEHAAGRITRPLRVNGNPYKGINVFLLWAEAMEKGYSAPFWMTLTGRRVWRACQEGRAWRAYGVCRHIHPHRNRHQGITA